MEPRKVYFLHGEFFDKGRDLLGVDSELLRPTAHPHPRTFDLEVRVDPDCSSAADS
jgi:hypothetical protein